MKVLIADDNQEFASTMSDIVRSFGYDTHALNTPGDAISYLEKFNKNIGIVLLDIEFGPGQELDGLDLLGIFRKNYPAIPVVMITGKGTIESAVRATKLGAVNFIEKSLVNKEKIKSVLESSLDTAEKENTVNEILKFLHHNGIIGKSKAITEIGDSIIRYGRTDLNVLVTGETGTGKKLVAKAIHAASRRARQQFVTVDIPNIPRELFQSELFGHIKGAFSGASETKKGLFHEANKGTVFLDEIGEMSLDLQSNLFIPIEEKIVRRVGSVKGEEIDIRFISATDKDLVEGMKDGKFREQLYHRLRECEIRVPTLEERKGDIPDIVDYYVQKHNFDFRESKFISPSAIEYLGEQNWPGNVRELASIIKVALQTSQKEQIEVNDLHKILSGSSRKNEKNDQGDISISDDRTLKEDIQQVDKRKIETMLEKCNGNVSKSAAMLGISRETLHNKIRRYNINAQQYRIKKKK